MFKIPKLPYRKPVKNDFSIFKIPKLPYRRPVKNKEKLYELKLNHGPNAIFAKNLAVCIIAYWI